MSIICIHVFQITDTCFRLIGRHQCDVEYPTDGYPDNSNTVVMGIDIIGVGLDININYILLYNHC